MGLDVEHSIWWQQLSSQIFPNSLLFYPYLMFILANMITCCLVLDEGSNFCPLLCLAEEVLLIGQHFQSLITKLLPRTINLYASISIYLSSDYLMSLGAAHGSIPTSGPSSLHQVCDLTYYSLFVVLRFKETIILRAQILFFVFCFFYLQDQSLDNYAQSMSSMKNHKQSYLFHQKKKKKSYLCERTLLMR